MLSVYLPCRAGSERVKNKNTRKFADNESLFTLKIKTLLSCRSIDEICVSTNDPLIMEQVDCFEDQRIKKFERKNELCLSNTKTDDLVHDMQEICTGDVLMWTHVTSPFLTNEIYEDMIRKFKNLSDHDALMTVTKHQTFLWYQGKPLNYDRSACKWPNTQTLPSVWEINSGAFIISKEKSIEFADRVGSNPFLYKTNFPANIDIDTIFDFEQAKLIYKEKDYTHV